MFAIDPILRPRFRELLRLMSLLTLLLSVTYVPTPCFGCPIECTCNSISGNFCKGLRHLPNSDVMIASSTEWHFDNGQFETISPGTFGNTLITKLSFKNGKLSKLPDGVFKNLKNLKELDLSGNQLSYVRRETFEGLENLEKLNLSRNYMWTYDPDVLKYLPSLHTLDIKSTSLACDSSTKGLKRYTEEYLVTVPEDNLCQNPEELRGLSFAQVSPREFRSHASYYPVFRIFPSTRQIVFEDDELPINCSVSIGSKDTKLVWFHDNKPVFNATNKRISSTTESQHNLAAKFERISETVSENRGVLNSMVVISQLKHEDTGKWECREENSQQEISRLSVDVMVLENSAIYCSKGVTHSNKGTFSWPKTVAGFSHPQYAVCPFGKSAEYSSNAGVAMATRTCSYTGHWSKVDDSACEFESQVSRELSQLAQVQITKDNYLEQLEKLVLITQSAAAASMTNLEDVKFVSQVVSKVWALVNDNDINFIGVMHNKVSELLLKVVSNMMSANENLLEKAEKTWGSCSNLIGRLQDFATLTANMADPVFGATAPNAAMKIIRVDTMAYSNSNAHYGFSCGLGIKRSDWFNPLLTSYQQNEIQCESPAVNLSDLNQHFASKGEVLVAGIVLPKSLFKLADDIQRFQNQFFKIHIIILRNSSLYPSTGKSTDEIGVHWNPQGPVIIANAVVGDMNNLGSEILPWGHTNVQIALSSDTPHSSDKRLDMWSSSKSWQYAGCDQLRPLSTEMNLSWSNCHRLGTYVITEPGVSAYERGIYFWHFVERVEPVVQLGSGVCVFFCVIVILTYLIFHRKLTVSGKSMHIVLNMSFSISALTSLFAWGLFTALNYPPSLIGCKLLGVSMHYFTLSTSTWMLILCFNVSQVFRLDCNCLYSQPESFCRVSQRESIQPSVGIPESNSGSVHNSNTDSHRRHQTSKPLQSLSKGIGIISESTNIVKFYVIGWGLPGVFCVMTALSSLAFYGDNQFCWIESKLVVVTLLLPAGVSSVSALGSLLRVLVSVPKTCNQNYGVKKTSPLLNNTKSSRVPGPVTECLLLPDRFPISNCAYPSQQSVNGMPGSNSGFNKHQHPAVLSGIPYYYDASSAMVYEAASISIQADFDTFSPDSKSYTMLGAPSVHSNQSNNTMGSPLPTGDIYPTQAMLAGSGTNFNSNAPLAFKISSPSGNNQNKLSCTYKHRMKCHYKLRSALILFFAMTASWVFGVMVIFYDEECHWIFSYLYAATTAFLGFFLFLNYCLLRNDVKSNYYAIFCNKKQTAITATRTSHNAYQISHSASLCAERKSSLSSVESSQKASAMHHARSQKNRSKTPTTPYTTSFCYSEVSAGNFHHNSQDSNHSHLSNSIMNQISIAHETQPGRLVSMQNSNQRGVGHVRSANMMHRGGIGTSSRSGSSVRDLDLASLPEHPVPIPNMGSNSATPVIQMLASRSQSSINEAIRNANSSNNSHGAQSDHESQKSQFNLGGQNTPVGVPHNCAIVALPPGPPPEVFKEHRSRSQKSGARIHPGISQGCHIPGANRRQQIPTPGSVPIATILPVCKNAPSDVIGRSGNYPRGMKPKSSSKIGGNESDGSYSSSDEDSSCSFDDKQPRHVLLRSTSRSTLSSDKTESRF